MRSGIHADITERIIVGAIEVHRHLGPGLLESAYEHALAAEFEASGLRYSRQVEVPVVYKGRLIDAQFRLDFLVEDEIIVEVKACETLLPVHSAQLLTYLRLASRSVGLLLNFDVEVMRNGVKRLIA